MKMADISETNALVYAGARLVTERLNVRPKWSHVQNEPPWKKRLEKQIKELRANLSKLKEWQKGSLKKKKEKDQLNPLTAMPPCGYSQRPVPHPMQYVRIRKYVRKWCTMCIRIWRSVSTTITPQCVLAIDCPGVCCTTSRVGQPHPWCHMEKGWSVCSRSTP